MFDPVRDRMNIYDIQMHDLRRTLGSYMAISGISLPIIGKALNDKSQVSTAIYTRLSNDPVLEAVNLAHSLMERRTSSIPKKQIGLLAGLEHIHIPDELTLPA